MPRIVVAGYMIRYPVAGNLLAYFHYVLGLHRLGYEVVYLEESGWQQSCYDPVGRNYTDDPRVGLRAVRGLMDQYRVNAAVCYVDRGTSTVYGGTWEDIRHMLKTSDLLLNIGGVCWLPEFHLCSRRAFIDMDPLFTQVGRHGVEGLRDHHVHFTYGVNVGKPGCTIPTRGIDWRPAVPPVVPEIWQNLSAAQENQEKRTDAPFTTIANWSAYGGANYAGEHYGQKDAEFLSLLELPRHVSQRLELALTGASAETRERLSSAGWSIRRGWEVSASVPAYQNYIAGSRGEFSVAKHAYVKTRSGWFSDRSVCYLAAGLPVILQDTGFSDWLPTGNGVLSFSSMKEAADCIERANAEYHAHCCAAREGVERIFSYKIALPRLLETALHIKTAWHSVIQPESAQ